MLRAIIFDLDGTLVDSLDDIGAAMNRALTAHGEAAHPLPAYRHFIGDGVRLLAERALGPGAAARPPTFWDALLTTYRREYAAGIMDRTRPYPGVPALLATLAARAIPTAVLSNKPDEPTRTLVAALLGSHPFVAVRGERPGTPRKPDPTSARELIAALGVPASACALLGDSHVDIETAKAAGLRALGAAWGFRGRSELEAAGADQVLAAPEELLELLD